MMAIMAADDRFSRPKESSRQTVCDDAACLVALGFAAKTDNCFDGTS